MSIVPMTKSYRNGKIEDQDRRLLSIEEKLDRALENELSHIKTTLARQDTDLGWIKKGLLVIGTASAGTLAERILSLL